MSHPFLSADRLSLCGSERAQIEPLLTTIETLANVVFTTNIDEEVVYSYSNPYNREVSRLLIRKLIELDLALMDPPLTADHLLFSLLTSSKEYDNFVVPKVGES